ncbi:hypothetical protein [Novosphingobium humi]|uniref:Lipocalin-like domain-containing protein n=1 Tax=Novosphingobium humi TaxID=2282397 RepID=A0ABY7TTP8_9SPHN|nr:hypothetical protein [Novosphingobium humi]WCT76597.1 hypothetical protein PQ457_11700 [Novosphingobium humi]
MNFRGIKFSLFTFVVLGLFSPGRSRVLPALVSPRELVGRWAVLHGNTKSEACRSDFISDFLPDGRYGGDMEDGVWSLSGDILTVKILRSNYDAGGEGPMRRLRQPEIRKIHVAKRRDGLISVDHDIAVRC